MIRGGRPGTSPGPGARWPSDLACGPAFVGPLVLCVLAGRALPLTVEVGLLTVAVAVAGWAATVPAGLVAVAASGLSLNGFRENGLGVLVLHPVVDVPVAVTLLSAWTVGWAVGQFARWPAVRSPEPAGSAARKEYEESGDRRLRAADDRGVRTAGSAAARG